MTKQEAQKAIEPVVEALRAVEDKFYWDLRVVEVDEAGWLEEKDPDGRITYLKGPEESVYDVITIDIRLTHNVRKNEPHRVPSLGDRLRFPLYMG
jgi:hypothetical protein